MIIPNLLVADMPASVAFYRDVIGLDLMIALGPGNSMVETVDAETVFATLTDGSTQLMLQTQAHVDQVLSNRPPTGPSWIYIRDLEPAPVAKRAAALLKGPEQTWYGMSEIHLADPDGNIVCVGSPMGPMPDQNE